jgi:hypothetical protein
LIALRAASPAGGISKFEDAAHAVLDRAQIGR